MSSQNIILTSIKYVFMELIGDLLYFPVWWYSQGLKRIALFCLNEVKNGQERLGLVIWIKNIFQPMFSQYDWQSRLISFFMRLVQIIIRSIMLLFWIIFVIIIFILWIVLPIVVIYQIVWQIQMLF